MRDLGLVIFRAAVRAVAFDFDLGLVMGSSEVLRRHPPHHLSPARANTRRGKILKRASAAPSHHSNAPIKHESQSILSKIVALTPSKGVVRKILWRVEYHNVRQAHNLNVVGSNPTPATNSF